MSATGPRTSLLAMFDPLNGAPASPARSDVDLPGGSLSDSDKENDMPPVAARAPGKLVPGATTAFFDRAGAAQAKFGQPRALKSRLVDVGDDSMDVDGADENVDMDIDLDASAQQEADESAKDTPTRVPFAELARAEPTPLTPQKMHAHSPFRRSPLVQMTPRRRSPRLSHSFTSPFAAVIESITSEADTEFCGLPGEEQIQDTSLPFSLGQDSSFERSLSFSHSIHADASFNAPIRISAASPSLSFEDPPASITPSGLQASPIPEFTGSSSFSLKRPSETSFDIVNDKLSFTSAGNDSMYRALEAAHGAQEEEAMLGALAAREVAKMKREGAWIIGEEKSSATSSLELAGSPMKVDRVTQARSSPTEPDSPSKNTRANRSRTSTVVPTPRPFTRSMSTGNTMPPPIAPLRITKRMLLAPASPSKRTPSVPVSPAKSPAKRSAAAAPLSPTKREAKQPRGEGLHAFQSLSCGPALASIEPLRLKPSSVRAGIAPRPSRVVTAPKRAPLAPIEMRRPSAPVKKVSEPVQPREMSGAAAVAARALAGGERRATGLPRPSAGAAGSSRLPAPSTRGGPKRV